MASLQDIPPLIPMSLGRDTTPLWDSLPCWRHRDHRRPCRNSRCHSARKPRSHVPS